MKFIDEIDIDLKKMIEADFGQYSKSGLNREQLLRWLHFKARQISPRYRKVFVSEEVKSKVNKYPVVTTIKGRLSFAQDLSPWLSERIRTRRSDFRADLLFNDWQIHHFHLGKFFETSKKIKRTGDVLFVFIESDHAVLLDIQPHNKWANKNLLEILLQTNPSDMEKYELKGIGQPYKPVVDNDLLRSRNAGTNSIIDISGKCYMAPGGGIVSSKHALRIVRHCDLYYDMKEAVINKVKNNSFPRQISRALSSNLLLPLTLGLHMHMGQLIVFDKNRRINLMEMKVLV